MNEYVETEPGGRKALTCLSPLPAASALIEMQALGSSTASAGVGSSAGSGHCARSNKSSPARSVSQQRRARPTELASFDSSDTWASCNPFPSLADLSGWSPQTAEQKPLYVKPVEDQHRHHQHATGAETDLPALASGASSSTADETSRLLCSQINTMSKPDDSPKSTKVSLPRVINTLHCHSRVTLKPNHSLLTGHSFDLRVCILMR